MLKVEIENVPLPPWQLHGSAVLSLWHRWSGLGLIHYTESPVGPYDEIAIISLTWRGPAVTAMGVTSSDSRRGGLENWGFPKQLASLQWRQVGERITFHAGARCWRWQAWGPRFPVRGCGWTVQTLHGEQVRVPVRVQGHGRLAWQGRQVGLLLEAFVMTVAGPKKL